MKAGAMDPGVKCRHLEPGDREDEMPGKNVWRERRGLSEQPLGMPSERVRKKGRSQPKGLRRSTEEQEGKTGSADPSRKREAVSQQEGAAFCEGC